MRKFNFKDVRSNEELYKCMKNMFKNMTSKAVCEYEEDKYIITKHGDDDYSMLNFYNGDEVDDRLIHGSLETLLKIYRYCWTIADWEVE